MAAAPLLIFLFIMVMIITLIGSLAAGGQGGGSYGGDGGDEPLSPQVLSYSGLVNQYCKSDKITGYENLVLAVMMQESGGSGTDPMQCSESPLNIKYPKFPNSITDPIYSVKTGTDYLASCLRAANCKSPEDMPGISLALQGYNFGGGYIAWAETRGGYSPANAAEFSNIKAQEMSWAAYGDTDYVSHVLRYYPSTGGNTAPGIFAVPLKKSTYNISRGYGYDGSELHQGIDYAAPAGTPIYAAAPGTVEYAQFGSAPYGGYGNVVVIRHNNTYETLYGHCSRLLVSTGQTVQRGTEIALVGSTGDSTGNHCHFEVRQNGNRINPKKYLG